MKFNLDNEVLFHSMSQLRTRSVCCNLFITDVNYYNKFRRLIWFQNLTKLIQHSDKEKNIYMKILTSLAYFSVIWQRMPQNFFPLILMNGMS